MPSRDRPSSAEVSLDPMKRWNVMGKYVKQPRGAKTIEREDRLSNLDSECGSRYCNGLTCFMLLVDLENLRQSNPCYGTLAPRKERPSPSELPYDPASRWNALGVRMEQPRGSKSVERALRLEQLPSSYSLKISLDVCSYLSARQTSRY